MKLDSGSRREVRGHHPPSNFLASTRVYEPLRKATLWAGRQSAHGTHYVRRKRFALVELEAARRPRPRHAGGWGQQQ